MLHKLKVLNAFRGNALRQTRELLGIKPRPKAPVLAQPVEKIIERHAWICQRLVDLWPEGLDLKGKSVCEIGSGDCLAAAAFFVGKGAAHVDLVEHQPPAVNAKQQQVLAALKQRGFPVSDSVITGGTSPVLNSQLVTYHKEHMENYGGGNQHGFVFSHCVLEHVEGLDAVFQASYRSLQPGGLALHVVDLGGHGQFEDPVPPLDFQTYPDWLYRLMYPIHHRATRRFLEDYRQAAASAGFEKIKIHVLRKAEATYVDSIRATLRPAAQQQSAEDISVIEFAMLALKPA